MTPSRYSCHFQESCCPNRYANDQRADKRQDKMGVIGLNIVVRVMGLLLAAIGVQFMADGMEHLLPSLA